MSVKYVISRLAPRRLMKDIFYTSVNRFSYIMLPLPVDPSFKTLHAASSMRTANLIDGFEGGTCLCSTGVLVHLPSVIGA